ncbi:MAG TPA: GlmU family protein [Saprospiraceae bacterium]|nr:GlmU family protein [Saprospiraceae bacterium]HMQ82730.1 GlmU family protein [Saprospiraceae bacterium]
MAQIILFDNEVREHLLPLTYTRPVCELRVGITTIAEKWKRALRGKIAYITQGYLAEKYSIDYDDVNYVINGSVLPSPELIRLIDQMDFNEAYLRGEELIVAKLKGRQIEQLMRDEEFGELNGQDLEGTPYQKINHLWDLVKHNHQAIVQDFNELRKGQQSALLPASNHLIGPIDQLYIAPGAVVEGAVLNTKTGPIYIGPKAEVMEGSLLRGPIALCESAVTKMGAKLYGPVTIGPYSKVGGEVSRSILQGYSNKAHDGYLGDSFLGEWCNIGAATNMSNLKNNYQEVKLWNYPAEKFVPTGEQFCGLFMGDHSKTGIGTLLNTGTVIGVSCNIFGEGFPRNFIPSFSWGGKHGFHTYRTDKAIETAELVMARRNIELDIQDRLILLRVFEDSAKYRVWEKE